MNCLRYLIKNDLNKELDKLFVTSLLLFKKFDGIICPICKIKQGSSFKGWNKYYCIHTEKKINKEIKEKQKKITDKIFLFTSYQNDQIVF